MTPVALCPMCHRELPVRYPDSPRRRRKVLDRHIYTEHPENWARSYSWRPTPRGVAV